ncbi:MAG: LysM peptidoglycan-binding domain-containing protein [Burkholderiales bacterium]
MLFRILLVALIAALCAGCASKPQRGHLRQTEAAVEISTPQSALARDRNPPTLANTADISGVAKTEHTDLWQRIRAGFALAELDSPLVAYNEAWYAARPDYLSRMVERSRRYLFHIVEAVEQRGMPMEIALLPVVESAFNPTAYSRSHASGIWQFIPSTATLYGLEQNWWYDGRRDIVAATAAALDYLQKLYAMFGDWELALAAYNCGEGAIGRSIAYNRAKGLPTDYLNLSLRAETRNYVPKLIAIKHIISNPDAYGLRLEPIPNQAYFTSVDAADDMDIAHAAHLAEISLDEFQALNPAHMRPVMTANGSSKVLLLPIENADRFVVNLNHCSAPFVSWRSYTVKPGERLSHIADRFDTTVARLAQVNDVSLKRRLKPGQSLLVPYSAKPERVLAGFKPFDHPDSSAVHRVKRGDTLYEIATQYGVSVEQLKQWNELASTRISVGQQLLIGAHADVAAARSVRYTVKPGDTLYAIAYRFQVAVVDLQRWNGLPASHILRPGDQVTIFHSKKT